MLQILETNSFIIAYNRITKWQQGECDKIEIEIEIEIINIG
jgi:hypothetical protein